jgi:hypothetical protein
MVGLVPLSISLSITAAGIRTERESFTYSICRFQIQLRTVAGFTPNACATSRTLSMVAIHMPPSPSDGWMLFADVLDGNV